MERGEAEWRAEEEGVALRTTPPRLSRKTGSGHRQHAGHPTNTWLHPQHCQGPEKADKAEKLSRTGEARTAGQVNVLRYPGQDSAQKQDVSVKAGDTEQVCTLTEGTSVHLLEWTTAEAVTGGSCGGVWGT